MNQKGFANILFVILSVVILVSAVEYLLLVKKSIQPVPPQKACTQEAKQCPDGSYVSRTGPHCEFALCPREETPPSASLNCKSDADCPSTRYTCQATQGVGTVYPNNSQPPTYTIVKGECKMKAGGACSSDAACVAGLVCHFGLCTNPVSSQKCSSPGDTRCPAGYTCIQKCGPPVLREGESLVASYFCELKELASKPRNCPICLAAGTLISTPKGGIAIESMREGMPIWTSDRTGHRVSGIVTQTSNVPVPPSHQMVHLVSADGRDLFASPGHPTIDGRAVGDLSPGDAYDGAFIVSAKRVP